MCFQTRRSFLSSSLFRWCIISIVKENFRFKMISYEKISGYNKNKEGVKCMVYNHYYFKERFNYHMFVMIVMIFQ